MSSTSKFYIFRFLHEAEGDEMKLSLATLVLSLMLVLYIISGPLLKKFQVKIIRPSGLVMILGILITLLTKIVNPDSTFFKIYSSFLNSRNNIQLYFYFLYNLLFKCETIFYNKLHLTRWQYYNNNSYRYFF